MGIVLRLGTTHTNELIVEQEHTALAFGSGTVPVYATPCMILHMEEAAANIVHPALPEEMSSVGTSVNIEHVAATPVGAKVEITAVLRRIDGRRLYFEVEASDDAGVIGKGTHERVIVGVFDFMEKTNVRAGRLPEVVSE